MKNEWMTRLNEEASIVLCGEAGQGIQTVEHVLTQTLKLSGYHVFSTEEYMSRNITNFVHNNMVYGLTKGQASPTSLQGFKTLVQREGIGDGKAPPWHLLSQSQAYLRRAIECLSGEKRSLVQEKPGFPEAL